MSDPEPQMLFVLNKDEFCLVIFCHKMDQTSVWRPVLTLTPAIEQTETKHPSKVKIGDLDYHQSHFICQIRKTNLFNKTSFNSNPFLTNFQTKKTGLGKKSKLKS